MSALAMTRNMTMKTLKQTAAVLLGIGLLASPQARAASSVGKVGAQFLKLGVGARALAMGSAFVAVADDPTAMYWNPGGMGQLKDRELTTMYNKHFQSTDQGYFGYVHPLGEDSGAWGVAWNYLQIASVPQRTADTTAPNYYFNNTNQALSVSYGHPNILIEKLGVGGSLKVIRESLDTSVGMGFAADLGALYKGPIDHLNLGVSILNLGPSRKLGHQADPLPLLMKVGASYKLFEDKLTLATSVDSSIREKRLFYDFGTEYWVLPSLALRTGYQVGRYQDQLGGNYLVGAAAGAGLRLAHLQVDYAFLPFGDLGDTHRFSIGYRF